MMWKRKLKGFDWSMLPFTHRFDEEKATFHPPLLTIMFLRPWFCSKGDIF